MFLYWIFEDVDCSRGLGWIKPTWTNLILARTKAPEQSVEAGNVKQCRVGVGGDQSTGLGRSVSVDTPQLLATFLPNNFLSSPPPTSYSLFAHRLAPHCQPTNIEIDRTGSCR